MNARDEMTRRWPMEEIRRASAKKRGTVYVPRPFLLPDVSSAKDTSVAATQDTPGEGEATLGKEAMVWTDLGGHTFVFSQINPPSSHEIIKAAITRGYYTSHRTSGLCGSDRRYRREA